MYKSSGSGAHHAGAFYISAIGMNIEVKGLDELAIGLGHMPKQVHDAVQKGLFNAAKIIKDEAVNNTPRSPTRQDYVRERQAVASAKGKWFKPRPNTRKATAFSRQNPGGLRRSITAQVWESNEASIFVAANAEGGAYAERIHDERGKSWHNLGPGSRALAGKGFEVGDKFIERAVRNNEGLVERKVQEQLSKVTL